VYPWQIFTRIVLPLSQPVLGALAIFAFRSAWNDFLWPLIAVLSALPLLIVFLVANRRIVEGVRVSALKG